MSKLQQLSVMRGEIWNIIVLSKNEFDFVEEEVSATIHINIYENKDERLSLSIKFSVIFPFDVISNFVGMLRR